jgi:hypothetical protein
LYFVQVLTIAYHDKKVVGVFVRFSCIAASGSIEICMKEKLTWFNSRKKRTIGWGWNGEDISSMDGSINRIQHFERSRRVRS